MSGFLSPDELRALESAATSSFASPIPTQIVSSNEFFPQPQNKPQREVAAPALVGHQPGRYKDESPLQSNN